MANLLVWVSTLIWLPSWCHKMTALRLLHKIFSSLSKPLLLALMIQLTCIIPNNIINFSDKQLKISAAFPTIYFSYSKWKNIVEITVTRQGCAPSLGCHRQITFVFG